MRHLVLALAGACPRRLEVIPGGLEWVIDDRTMLVPDVMVVDPTTVDDDEGLLAPPLLVVEVLSPSTRRHDLVHKRRAYADGGCPGYWIVDPVGPWLLALELAHGHTYRAEADLDRHGTLRTARPFPLEIVVAELGRPAS